MTANRLDDIYSDFRASFENSPDFVINFFANHSVYFNNITSFKNQEDLGLFIELTWQYLNAIYAKSRFSEITNTVDQKLAIIDNELGRLSANDLKNDWYYGLHLIKGMALFHDGDYKTAGSIFKGLMASQHRRVLWLLNPLWILWAFLIFNDIFLKDYITKSTSRLLSTIGLLCMLITWGYDYYMRRKIRNTKKQ
jgi:hypothetical protein